LLESEFLQAIPKRVRPLGNFFLAAESDLA
jgi:hypothetical protein